MENVNVNVRKSSIRNNAEAKTAENYSDNANVSWLLDKNVTRKNALVGCLRLCDTLNTGAILSRCWITFELSLA